MSRPLAWPMTSHYWRASSSCCCLRAAERTTPAWAGAEAHLGLPRIWRIGEHCAQRIGGAPRDGDRTGRSAVCDRTRRIAVEVPKPTENDKDFFRTLVPENPRVEIKPMFGNLAAFVNGNMFMGLFGSDLGLKLADADRERLLAEDGAGPYG